MKISNTGLSLGVAVELAGEVCLQQGIYPVTAGTQGDSVTSKESAAHKIMFRRHEDIWLLTFLFCSYDLTVLEKNGSN